MATIYTFTGETVRPRAVLAEMVAKAGGVVESKVTRSTTYCVVGSDGGGSRAALARYYGVPCITEDELCELLRVDRGAVVASFDRATKGIIEHTIAQGRVSLA